MIIMKKIVFLSLFFMLILSFSGCFARLENKKRIENNCEKYFPASEFVRIESKTDEKVVYIFKTDKFEFKVQNYIMPKTSERFFPEEAYDTDYLDSLCCAMHNDIAGICEKYGFAFDNYFYDSLTPNKDVTYESSYLSLNWCYGISYVYHVENGEDIAKIPALMKEIEDVMSPYYPTGDCEYFEMKKSFCICCKEEKFFDEPFENSFSGNAGEYLFRNYENTMIDDIWPFSFDDAVLTAEYNYTALIVENSIYDDSFRADNFKPRFLTELIINGEKIENEEIYFLYNPLDGQYYFPLCFSADLTYNEMYKTYPYMEIIETYYSNSQVMILPDENKIIYDINGCSYELRDNEGLEIYKDGTQLMIPSYDAVNLFQTNAAFVSYISVNDFADIMEMDVEKIDETNNKIYFKVR